MRIELWVLNFWVYDTNRQNDLADETVFFFLHNAVFVFIYGVCETTIALHIHSIFSKQLT